MKFKYEVGSLSAPSFSVGTEAYDLNLYELERSESLAAFESCMIDFNIYSNTKGFEAEDPWYKKLWEKIKAMFKAIGRWLISLWNWIFSKFNKEGTIEMAKVAKEEVKAKTETISKVSKDIENKPEGMSKSEISKSVSKHIDEEVNKSELRETLKDIQSEMENEVKDVILNDVTEEDSGKRKLKRSVINTHLSYYIFDKGMISRYEEIQDDMWVQSFTSSDVIKNNMLIFARSAYVCAYILCTLYSIENFGKYKVNKEFTDEDKANLNNIENVLKNMSKPSIKLEHKSIDVKIVNGTIETIFTQEEKAIMVKCETISNRILSGIKDIKTNLKTSMDEIDKLDKERPQNITEEDIKMVTETLSKVRNICKITTKLIGSANMKKLRNNASEFHNKVERKL
jgi:hypothetical protein|nr:MAG TPA: hypothetical protein [Caudoviricetes sp.]